MDASGTIVGMDPGRHLGICKAPAKAKSAIVPGATLRTLKLRDTTDLGAFLRSADDPIREALSGASLVAVERPNTQGQNHSGIVKNCALYGLIAYWAAHHGVPFQGVNVSHVKSILTDSGNAKKEQVISSAEFYLGVPAGTLDEHMADAMGAWMVACYGAPASHADRHKLQVQRRRDEKAAAKQKGPLL